MAVARDHDILWLQIAMNNANRMCLGEPFGRVLEIAKQLCQISLTAAQ